MNDIPPDKLERLNEVVSLYGLVNGGAKQIQRERFRRRVELERQRKAKREGNSND